MVIRACLKNRSGRDCERGGADGEARRGRIFARKSVTEEQRSQAPRPAARPPEILFKYALRQMGKKEQNAARRTNDPAKWGLLLDAWHSSPSSCTPLTWISRGGSPRSTAKNMDSHGVAWKEKPVDCHSLPLFSGARRSSEGV